MPQESAEKQPEKNDIQEKKTRLNHEISLLSLAYAEKKYQEALNTEEPAPFSQILKQHTPLKSILRENIRLSNPEKNDEKFWDKVEEFTEDFFKETDLIHESSDYSPEKIWQLLEQKQQESLTVFGSEPSLKKEDGPEFSFLKINKITDQESAQKPYASISKVEPEIPQSALLMEIHLDSAYEKPEINIGLATIKKDLSKLAEYIIDNIPETEAVVGTSWLIDAIGEKFGFTKIKNTEPTESDFSSWLQFINKDGGIDLKRAEQMLQTGKLPFSSTSGYIKIEDFLKRYLPENRRGEIKLRPIDPEKSAFFDALRKNGAKRSTDWSELLEQNNSLQSFLDKNQDMITAINLLEAEDQKTYFDFLQTMLDQKIPWDEMEKHATPEMDAMSAKIKAVVDASTHQEKIINIPPKK